MAIRRTSTYATEARDPGRHHARLTSVKLATDGRRTRELLQVHECRIIEKSGAWSTPG